MFGSPEEEAALLAAFTPEERGERLIRNRWVMDLLELMWSDDAVAYMRTDDYEREGFSTPLDFLRINCHMTMPQVVDRVDVGLHIDDMPESTQAMTAGEVGFAHLVQMARFAEQLRQSETASAPFDEAPLLAAAREESVGKLHYMCRNLRHSFDPVGYANDEAEAVELRSLEISSGGDGLVSIKGTLDSAGAAALRQALEPFAKKCGKGDRRKRKQRLADALVELASGGQPAQLQVTASVETLLGLAGAPPGSMEFSLPIGAPTVQRLACDCNIVRVLMAADSTVIDVGRSTRKVSPSTRRAVESRDRGCRWPHCDRPARWTDAHHLKHWVHEGETEPGNLLLLCYRHHRYVHEGGWQIVVCDDGRILVIPPPTPVSVRARGPD